MPGIFVFGHNISIWVRTLLKPARFCNIRLAVYAYDLCVYVDSCIDMCCDCSHVVRSLYRQKCVCVYVDVDVCSHDLLSYGATMYSCAELHACTISAAA